MLQHLFVLCSLNSQQQHKDRNACLWDAQGSICRFVFGETSTSNECPYPTLVPTHPTPIRYGSIIREACLLIFDEESNTDISGTRKQILSFFWNAMTL